MSACFAGSHQPEQPPPSALVADFWPLGLLCLNVTPLCLTLSDPTIVLDVEGAAFAHHDTTISPVKFPRGLCSFDALTCNLGPSASAFSIRWLRRVQATDAIILQVTLPPDIHPLPEEIAAYFVYPYTLEDFVTQPQPPHEAHATRIAKLRESHDARVKFLKERELEKTKKRKDALRKLAPGYEPPDSGDEGNDSGGNAGMATLSPDGNAFAKRKSGILEPTRRSTQTLLSPDSSIQARSSESEATTAQPRDVMDDLVEGLAKLDQDQAT